MSTDTGAASFLSPLIAAPRDAAIRAMNARLKMMRNIADGIEA